MKKNLIYGFIAILSIGFWSCDDDENYDPAVGILEVSATPQHNAIGYTYQINQGSLTIDNTNDPVVFDVNKKELEQATLSVKTTLGIGLEVYYNGMPLHDGKIVGDISQPGKLEIRGYGQNKTYTLNTTQATHIPEGENVILKSTDMRSMGIPSTTKSFQATYFNDKFYCFTTSSDGETAEYGLYTSDNGVQWEPATYGPDAVQAVGGENATLAQWNNRLYVLGGGRTSGPDKWGNEAESFWGLPDCVYWRSHSTADGSTFRCDTVGVTGTWRGNTNTMLPSPSSQANIAVLGNKMYLKSAYRVSFYTWQGTSEFKETTDGTNWSNVTITTEGVDVKRRLGDAFFSFKGKLWCIGGFTSWINPPMLSSIYSSSDGSNWSLEAEETPLGKMWGMKVVTYNDEVAYLIGGEYFNENKERTLSDKIYRSTDGVHWEAIETGSKYKARRNPQIAVKDGYAYIFGGFTEPSSGNYGYEDQVPAFDTYVLELK